MHPRERLVIYGALALLGVSNALFLLRGPGPAAWAEPIRWADELGPADAVKLGGKDGEMILRNRDGRLSWSDKVTDRAHSMAFVHVGNVLSQLVDSEDLVEERQALLDELQVTEAEYQEQLNALRGRVEGRDPQDADAKAAAAEGQRLLQEYRQWGAEAQQRTAALQARHFEQVYREMLSAVNVVADRADIDIVLRFVPPDTPFEGVTPDQAMTTIRLRAALRYPEDLDITTDVLEELSLETE